MFDCAILKLTARCNLDCTYCYMFNLEDQTYRRVPARMPAQTALLALERIETHLTGRERKYPFSIVLHGGEPTLWPDERFGALLARIAAMRARGIRVNTSIQTNGLRLRPSLLDILAEHDVKIGISLDGPEDFNDRARRTPSGHGSYTRVMRSVNDMIARGHRDLLSGFLAVADPDLSPAAFLDWAAELPVTRLDVLWPIGFHHGNPPWSPGGRDAYMAAPRYGTWFADLFEEWWRRDDPELVVRLFFDCIKLVLGGRGHTDTIVNDRNSSFVVNTDGAIEYPDYFRAARDGGSRTPFNVFDGELNDVMVDPVFDYCLNLKAYLPSECVGCPQVDLCGGGFLPGRMNPLEQVPRTRSILCADMYHFFDTVKRRVAHAEALVTR